MFEPGPDFIAKDGYSQQDSHRDRGDQHAVLDDIPGPFTRAKLTDFVSQESSSLRDMRWVARGRAFEPKSVYGVAAP
jgi:hypothetical protein